MVNALMARKTRWNFYKKSMTHETSCGYNIFILGEYFGRMKSRFFAGDIKARRYDKADLGMKYRV